MPLIEFNNLNKNAFISFLQSFNNSTELEFRFGNFVYDKNSSNSHFVSNTEIDFFHRLKLTLNQQLI